MKHLEIIKRIMPAAAVFAVGCLVAGRAAAQAEYRVPYRVSESSHIVVRAKLNGEGPFNFILDSGAPVFFVNVDVARYLGMNAAPGSFMKLNRVEVEGGPVLEKFDVRFENMMQVSGMNQKKLSALRLDGAMGYSVMAHFRIEMDMTRPYLVWTKLNFAPRPPAGAPASALNLAERPAAFAYPRLKRPVAAIQDLRDPLPGEPGFLGIELDASDNPVVIHTVIKGSAADTAGLKAGDAILEFGSRPVSTPEDLERLSPSAVAGRSITLKIRRGSQTMSVTVKPTAGL